MTFIDSIYEENLEKKHITSKFCVLFLITQNQITVALCISHEKQNKCIFHFFLIRKNAKVFVKSLKSFPPSYRLGDYK